MLTFCMTEDYLIFQFPEWIFYQVKLKRSSPPSLESTSNSKGKYFFFQLICISFSSCLFPHACYFLTFDLVWTLMPPSYCTLHGTQKIFFPNIQHAMKLSFGAKMHHKSPITIFSFSLLPSFKVDGKGEVVTRELLRQTSTHHAKGVN